MRETVSKCWIKNTEALAPIRLHRFLRGLPAGFLVVLIVALPNDNDASCPRKKTGPGADCFECRVSLAALLSVMVDDGGQISGLAIELLGKLQDLNLQSTFGFIQHSGSFVTMHSKRVDIDNWQ